MTPPRLFVSFSLLDGMALALLSTGLTALAVWSMLWSQRVAQKPASEGVMTFHLGRRGELRLWNQPIRPQDLPGLLDRAQSRTAVSQTMVVRLIPDPQVPWGVTRQVLSRLQPTPPERHWILQLQLP